MPNSFAHIELTTDDLKAARKFYSKVFAWKLNDMPGMNYTMIDVGGGTGGGMQVRPMPEAPTGWMPYVQVDDVKTTVAKAAKAGATIVLPYQEIGEMGAIGVFADPQGAFMGVWAAKETSTASAAAADSGKKAAAKPKAQGASVKQAAASPKKAAPAKVSAPAKRAVAPAQSAKPAKKIAAGAKKSPLKKR